MVLVRMVPVLVHARKRTFSMSKTIIQRREKCCKQEAEIIFQNKIILSQSHYVLSERILDLLEYRLFFHKNLFLAILPTTISDKDGDPACCQTFETRLHQRVKDNNQSLRNHSTEAGTKELPEICLPAQGDVMSSFSRFSFTLNQTNICLR